MGRRVAADSAASACPEASGPRPLVVVARCAALKPVSALADTLRRDSMRVFVEDVIARFVMGTLAASMVVGYVTVGAAVTAVRSLLSGTRSAAGLLPRRGTRPRSSDRTPPVSHTLRIVYDQTDMAQPFAGLGGATHMIVLDPTAPHLEARLAHEFAHILLAVVRGAPAHAIPGYPTDAAELPKSRLVHAEECAAWALAQAITRDSIWSRDALACREQALRRYHVPRRLRSPTIPAPTCTLVRWLAQIEV